MYQFKDGWLWPGVEPQIVSFKIPDTLMPDTEDDTEESDERGYLIRFRSTDGLVGTLLRFGTMHHGTAREEMEQFLGELGGSADVTDVTYAGFSGCRAIRKEVTEDVTFLDVSRLGLRDGSGNFLNLLEFSLYASDAKDTGLLAGWAGTAEGILGSIAVEI